MGEETTPQDVTTLPPSVHPYYRRRTAMSYRNLSNLDRAVRIVLGALMLAAGWSGAAQGIVKIGCEIFGWVPLVTGAIGWCPMYALLGWSTRRPGG